MSTFTVSLPQYGAKESFDTERFIQLFPNSVIALALQSGENDVPLENSLVTPSILELLQEIVTTGRYRYISDPSRQIRRALDYLNIDLPEPIFDPKYEQFQERLPLFNLNDFTDYAHYLGVAVREKFPELAKYLFAHTEPRAEDFLSFRSTLKSLQISPDEVSILLMILRTRDIVPRINRYAETFQEKLWDQIIQAGEPDLFEEYIQAFPESPEKFNLVTKLLNRMRNSPYNYIRNFDLLSKVGPYLATPRQLEERESVSMDQGPLYDLIRASATGDSKLVDNLLTNNINEEDINDLGSVVAYTALIQGHYTLAWRIFEQEVKYIQDNYDKTVDDEDEVSGEIRLWVGYIVDMVLAHPEWLTPRGIHTIVDGINALDNINPYPTKFLVNLREELQEKGYPELAKLV